MSESKKEKKTLPTFEPSITSILKPQNQEKETCIILALQDDNDGILSKADKDTSKPILTSSSEKFEERPLKICMTDFLMDFNALPAPIIRFLFREIAGEISKLHLDGVYHGDLSLENVFFDQDYNVSLSQKVNLHAPFLDGVYLDLVGLGEILFALCFGSPPFISLEDERYLAILNGEWDLFWTINEKTLKIEKRNLDLSKSGLKDLISKFWSGRPKSKHDLVQLLAHEWMKGVTHTRLQVKSLLNEVRKKIQKIT